MIPFKPLEELKEELKYVENDIQISKKSFDTHVPDNIDTWAPMVEMQFDSTYHQLEKLNYQIKKSTDIEDKKTLQEEFDLLQPECAKLNKDMALLIVLWFEKNGNGRISFDLEDSSYFDRALRCWIYGPCTPKVGKIFPSKAVKKIMEKIVVPDILSPDKLAKLIRYMGVE